MTDHSELKRLCGLATQGVWVKHKGRMGGVVYGGPIQHWVRGSGQSQIAMTTGAEWMRPGENEDNAAFIAAANPEVVGGLIAENERLDRESQRLSDQLGSCDRDRRQLKAENEALKKRIEDMSPFKGAPLTGPDLKCLACGGYHYGMQGLPCPNMRITASALMGKEG